MKDECLICGAPLKYLENDTGGIKMGAGTFFAGYHPLAGHSKALFGLH